MFLKTQGMSGRDRASGHAVYNYTNQNDTFAKYDAFRKKKAHISNIIRIKMAINEIRARSR